MGCLQSDLSNHSKHQIENHGTYQSRFDVNPSNEAEMYDYSFIDNQPLTLVITKKPKYLEQLMFQVPKFFWFNNFNQNFKHKIKSVGQQIDENMFQIKSIQQAQNLLSNNKLNYCLVLCEGEILKQLYKKISKFSCLKGFICCSDHQEEDKAVREKVLLVTEEVEKIVSFIKKNKSLYYKNKEQFNFIQIIQSVQDSNNFSRTISSMLMIKCNREFLIAQIVDLAHRMWGHQTGYIAEFESKIKSDTNLPTKDSIYWYTRQTFLYKLVNILLRSARSPCQIFILQPYFKDLFLAIHSLGRQQKTKSTQKWLICYRGARVQEKQFKALQRGKGKIVRNLTFMSTSSRKEVAKKLIQNCFITIYVNLKNHEDQGFAKIDEFSAISNEDQILFNPLNSFKVLKAIQNSSKIFEIELAHGEIPLLFQKEQKDLSQYQSDVKELIKYQSSKQKENVIFGELLGSHYQRSKLSLNYWKKLMTLNQSSHSVKQISLFNPSLKISPLKIKPEIAYNMINMQSFALTQLSFVQEIQGNFKGALQLSNLALEKLKPQNLFIRQKLACFNNMSRVLVLLKKPAQAVNLLNSCFIAISILNQKLDHKLSNDLMQMKCITWNHLGLAFSALDKPSTSIELLERCVSVNKHLSNSSENISTLHCNLAQAYCQNKKFGQAANHAQKAMEIERSIYGIDHPCYSISLYNFSAIQVCLGDYSGALENLKRCQKIFQKHYTTQHHYSLNCMYLQIKCLFELERYEESLEMLNKWKKIRINLNLDNLVENENLEFIEGVNYFKLFKTNHRRTDLLKSKHILSQYLKHRTIDLYLPRTIKILSLVYRSLQKKWISTLLMQKYMEYELPDTLRESISNCLVLAYNYFQTCEYEKAIKFTEQKLKTFQNGSFLMNAETIMLLNELNNIKQKAMYLFNYEEAEVTERKVLNSLEYLDKEEQEVQKLVRSMDKLNIQICRQRYLHYQQGRWQLKQYNQPLLLNKRNIQI